MTLKFNNSLLVAKKVLNAVNKLLCEKKLDTKNFWVESYSNGREQGYCINSLWHSISFSEYRGSDSIVVYVGECFSNQGNVPSEESYTNAKFFKIGDFNKAASFIVADIKKAEQYWKNLRQE